MFAPEERRVTVRVGAGARRASCTVVVTLETPKQGGGNFTGWHHPTSFRTGLIFFIPTGIQSPEPGPGGGVATPGGALGGAPGGGDTPLGKAVRGRGGGGGGWDGGKLKNQNEGLGKNKRFRAVVSDEMRRVGLFNLVPKKSAPG